MRKTEDASVPGQVLCLLPVPSLCLPLRLFLPPFKQPRRNVGESGYAAASTPTRTCLAPPRLLGGWPAQTPSSSFCCDEAADACVRVWKRQPANRLRVPLTQRVSGLAASLFGGREETSACVLYLTWGT